MKIKIGDQVVFNGLSSAISFEVKEVDGFMIGVVPVDHPGNCIQWIDASAVHRIVKVF